MDLENTAEELKKCREKWGMEQKDFAKLIGCNEADYENLISGKSKWDINSARNANLMLEIDYALSKFYDDSEIRTWLRSSQQLFNGENPLNLLMSRSFDDKTRVYQSLKRLEEGVYI